jgi:hypothetical protein
VRSPQLPISQNIYQRRPGGDFDLRLCFPFAHLDGDLFLQFA